MNYIATESVLTESVLTESVLIATRGIPDA